MVYPLKIAERIRHLQHGHTGLGFNAVGTEANFSCGCFVRVYLDIDPPGQVAERASFASNGCGWMVASAERFCENISGMKLADLHGLDESEMLRLFTDSCGEVESGRAACIVASINAMRAAFADFRSRRIEEFRGDEALICTCFGVTEESIADAILNENLRTVDEVADNRNAGSGCGSCRMLIQEIIDKTSWVD